MKKIKIPISEIKNFEVRPPIVIADKLRRRYKFRELFRALKIDFVDFNRHVVVEKNTGILKQIRFTPSNPE